MEKYLIELEHDPDPRGCARVVRIFLETGSHYLAQADWGCMDGHHSAWMIVDADSRDQARQIVPPPFRASARIVQLNKFTMEQIERLMRHHEHPKSGDSPGPAD